MGALLSCLSITTASRKQGAFYTAYKINEELGQKLMAVGIGKKQLFALHEIFNAMDKDNSGEINVLEFFNYIDLKRSRFSEKAFTVMDRDGSGEVDFIEFVLAVWNYCSFSRASLVRFAFDLYDTDGSGEIERDEASHCVREIWGGDWEHNANAQKVLAKLDAMMQSTPSGRLTIQMFQDFAQRHPILLFPAFQLQTEIQHRVLGERFWQTAARKRSQLDPRELNWRNFEKFQKTSRQASQRFLQTIEDSLHDDVFEPAESPPPLPQPPEQGQGQELQGDTRKRPGGQPIQTKVRSRKAKVFLEATGVDGKQDHDSSAFGAKRTMVTTFEDHSAEDSTASSPSGKSVKSPVSKRPQGVAVETLDIRTDHTPSALGESATSPSRVNKGHGSPKKMHAAALDRRSSSKKKSDLIVENMSERGSRRAL